MTREIATWSIVIGVLSSLAASLLISYFSKMWGRRRARSIRRQDRIDALTREASADVSLLVDQWGRFLSLLLVIFALIGLGMFTAVHIGTAISVAKHEMTLFNVGNLIFMSCLALLLFGIAGKIVTGAELRFAALNQARNTRVSANESDAQSDARADSDES